MPETQTSVDWFSRDLIEILPAAVYVCDINAVVVAFNKRATELWGRIPRVGDRDEKYCGAHRLFLTNGAFLPHAETPMARVLRTGETVRDQEVIIERPDGSRVTVLVNIAPVFDKGGVQIGAVNCFQDLTVQKQSEEQRGEMHDALRQSQKLTAIGQLVGGVAHDFNNLLTPIIGSLDMLINRGAFEARELRLMNGALESAERAKTLVQRLLAFARRQPLQSEPVDIGKLITGMNELIVSTVGPQIKLTCAIAADLPYAKVDANQVEMAILNLSINARDAMPDGGMLQLTVVAQSLGREHVSQLPAGDYINLTIADTGQGMDDETAARAVEPFFSTKGIGKGTGLGLSMVDGLVSQLGGALMLTSKLGRGTTVELLLPVSEEMIRPASAVGSINLAIEAKGRMLLVDDEYLVRSSTVDMLVDLGYEVLEASSAEDAWKMIEHDHSIVGVITDHLMPGMTGVELAHAVQQARPDMPVLIVSGFADVEGLASDFALLTKPFRQQDLAKSLAEMLGKVPLQLVTGTSAAIPALQPAIVLH
jgi:PAS domain S-box-containing protein